jgi:hypothetical protein
MGKFEKYANGKIAFNVSGEPFALTFSVEDRIKYAQLFEIKEKDKQFDALIEYFSHMIMRSYPGEDVGEIKNFLALYVDEFAEEFMVAANLAKKADIERKKEELMQKKTA